jgi:hypothetical protein
MANAEHLAILSRGVLPWNEWRDKNPGGRPDLSGADLRRANLHACCLRETDLSTADLTLAELRGADLRGADLRGANLTAVNIRCFLDGADLENATSGGTVWGKVDLSVARNIDSIRHLGPSTIGIDTFLMSKGRIPDVFLRGCGVPETMLELQRSLVGALAPIQFYSCFISYSHKDEEFCKRLHARMQQEGLRVWYAAEDMAGGKKLHEQIDEAIRLYDKLLLVLSEARHWMISKARPTRFPPEAGCPRGEARREPSWRRLRAVPRLLRRRARPTYGHARQTDVARKSNAPLQGKAAGQ